MDILALLEQGHSKELARRIADHIGSDPVRFKVLMGILLNGTPRLVQRAAWPMGIVCETHPELAKPYVQVMLDLLSAPVHEAVHRNVVRTFQFCALPKKYHGRITDVMFAWIADPNKPIAPRASAITVARRMVTTYPELAAELHVILETVLHDHPGPAIHSRAIKALKDLRKEIEKRN